MERYVHQTLEAAGATCLHRRNARYRLGREAIVSNQAESAWTFGHEHRAVGKKRDRPRLLQMLRENRHPNVPFLGSLEIQRMAR
jgi:hypothetical protein